MYESVFMVLLRIIQLTLFVKIFVRCLSELGSIYFQWALETLRPHSDAS